MSEPNSDYLEALQQIGLSAINHSQLDFCLLNLSYQLANVRSDVGETLFGTQSTSSLVKGLLKLASLRLSDPEQQSSFKKFLGDVDRANKRRNDILHGLWALDQTGRLSRVGKKALALPEADFEKKPERELEQLRQLNAEFDRLINDGFTFFGKFLLKSAKT